MTDSGSTFRRNRQLAWAAARKLTRIWNGDIRGEVKMQLFTSTVASVLLYSYEDLEMTDSLAQTIDASHRALMRDTALECTT